MKDMWRRASVFVSLCAGLGFRARIETFIKEEQQAHPHLWSWAAWLVVIVLLCLLIEFLAVLLQKVFGFLSRGRLKDLKELQRMCMDAIKNMNVYDSELAMEKKHDLRAFGKLNKYMHDAQEDLLITMNSDFVRRTEHFAQRPWCLRQAVLEHVQAEVVDPFMVLYTSPEDMRLTCARSRMGIRCINMLLKQFHEEAGRHPIRRAFQRTLCSKLRRLS